MKLNEKGKIKYFTFESFDKTGLVKHCFSTRQGGVSQNCYESMNLSFREDKPENVRKNYELICSAIGCNSRDTVFSDQIHCDEIYFPKDEDRGKALFGKNPVKGADALVTDNPNILLVTFYADCVPIYLLDTEKKVIALVHSGWRGTVKQISAKTIAKMEEKGSKRENIIAGIGPCIGKCCFQIDKPVVDEFKKLLPFSSNFIYNDSSAENKFLADLTAINKQILINAGIKQIETADICTKCNPELFFSHRNMGAERGSLAALMQIRE